ncbi:hypothetical protein Slin14017_G107410 [Septoria linicola]|nr:hypothetical protein Slin14017_G107410 [Septoria linicola]
MFQTLLHDTLKIYSSIWAIPNTSDAQEELKKHLESLTLVSQQPKELLVVYYTGHGYHDREAARQGVRNMTGHPKRDGPELSVDWVDLLRDVLTGCGKDVVLILDCCCAAASFKAIKRSRTVTIAACDAAAKTPGPGQKAFTTTFLNRLQSFDKPFSVAQRFDTVRSSRWFPYEPVLRHCEEAEEIFLGPGSHVPYAMKVHSSSKPSAQTARPPQRAYPYFLLSTTQHHQSTLLPPQQLASGKTTPEPRVSTTRPQTLRLLAPQHVPPTDSDLLEQSLMPPWAVVSSSSSSLSHCTALKAAR